LRGEAIGKCFPFRSEWPSGKLERRRIVFAAANECCQRPFAQERVGDD
jgi:hypothetical protein